MGDVVCVTVGDRGAGFMLYRGEQEQALLMLLLLLLLLLLLPPPPPPPPAVGGRWRSANVTLC